MAGDPLLGARAAVRTAGTHLLLDEARGAAADGQQRRVAQRLAHREATQQSVALQEKETSASPQTPAGAGWGWGRAHLQDV